MKYIPTVNIHAAVEVIASASCSLSLLYLLTTGSIYRLIAPNSYIIALLWALVDKSSHIPRAKIYITNAIREKRKLREGTENNFQQIDSLLFIDIIIYFT